MASSPPTGSLPGCKTRYEQACDGGDVWWFDSCGRPEQRIEACEGRLCEAGRCVEPPAGPPCKNEQVSEAGRCENDVLRYCDNGIARAVDCAALGQRCGIDEDGGANCVAQLRAPSPRPSPLVRRLSLEAVKRDPCHGCPCPKKTAPGPELCDGYDNDDDNEVDEGVECPPIDVVAFLVADVDGRTAESEERVRAEIEFSAGMLADAGLPLRLRDVRVIVRPPWLEATAATVAEMRSDGELHRADESFFVPLVYTRELTIGAKKAAGVGTLPLGQCAAMVPPPERVDDRGVVALARLRRPTTLAHELGHYLGLCHTFQRDRDAAEIVVQIEEGGMLACAQCSRSGDGVCDTPPDPGIDEGVCTIDERCAATCSAGAAPDPLNLMSYYHPCRRHFSPEQGMYLRRWWWLRRGWRP